MTFTLVQRTGPSAFDYGNRAFSFLFSLTFLFFVVFCDVLFVFSEKNSCRAVKAISCRWCRPLTLRQDRVAAAWFVIDEITGVVSNESRNREVNDESNALGHDGETGRGCACHKLVRAWSISLLFIRFANANNRAKSIFNRTDWSAAPPFDPSKQSTSLQRLGKAAFKFIIYRSLKCLKLQMRTRLDMTNLL